MLYLSMVFVYFIVFKQHLKRELLCNIAFKSELVISIFYFLVNVASFEVGW